MRTKQEVINFLESKVGTKVVCKGNESLSGQCVSLIKSLMEFLGVPDPYKARGHAKTVINAYISEGIADPGIGLLTVLSNKDMGGGYGHIWCNAGSGGGVFYESNGAKPLIVTKGKAYAYDNVCNFDKYLTEAGQPVNDMEEQLLKDFGVKTLAELKTVWDREMGFLKDERTKNQELKNQLKDADTIATNLRAEIKKLQDNPITTEGEPNGKQVAKYTYTQDGKIDSITTTNYVIDPIKD